ncbi:hypothetical protein J6590_076607 [Homalodisca vitripennis]|nr:hypothetical protein J6590_076607 [Homalodisca vitripennis]
MNPNMITEVINKSGDSGPTLSYCINSPELYPCMLMSTELTKKPRTAQQAEVSGPTLSYCINSPELYPCMFMSSGLTKKPRSAARPLVIALTVQSSTLAYLLAQN